MRIKSALLGVLFAMAPVFPVLAQQPSNLAILNNQVPKPGMAKQFEAARAKHMGWHKSQKDAWSWYVWEVVSGDNTGAYLTGSFGHAWKDLDGRDSFDKADMTDMATTMGPSVAHSTVSYWVERADLSLSPSTPGSSPAPFSVVTTYHLNPDGVNDFVEAVKKVNDAIKKTNYAVSGPSRWYQLVNGGEVPTYALVGDRANWAAFQPNEKTLDVMMGEAFGKEQGAAILASVRKTFRSLHVSTYQYRPELSYLPAAAK
ncbi:MAG: hypothetical protein ACLPJH_06650 [Myxococcaceae bacterium]